MKHFTQRAVVLLAVFVLVLGAAAARAQRPDNGSAVFQDAIGSWFGRAIPVPGETICPAGAPGCPVPPEIVMVFTVNADGTFIGIDSNIFAGGTHSTAHGQWVRQGPRSIKAEFTLLQSSPVGVFIGGFKNLFNATVQAQDEMTGGIDAYLYSYTGLTARSSWMQTGSRRRPLWDRSLSARRRRGARTSGSSPSRSAGSRFTSHVVGVGCSWFTAELSGGRYGRHRC